MLVCTKACRTPGHKIKEWLSLVFIFFGSFLVLLADEMAQVSINRVVHLDIIVLLTYVAV